MFQRTLTLTFTTGRVEQATITGTTRRDVRRAAGQYLAAALDTEGPRSTVLGRVDGGALSEIVFGAIKRTK